ncbi:MAG: ABC transporter ATP-binding protein [Candidatus Pacebacteria bacterium]|nr:ABC transporter ATP-binding protein [Candidatus Paceibacterota bacterium]
MIKIKNLTKTFIDGERKVQALRDITFDVPEGQFLTITGKSGSGKSTLLYQLGLLDIPTSGVIEIDGVDMIKLNETDRTLARLNDLGYIFQDYAIIPSLTALENTMVPLLMQGYSESEAKQIAIKALQKIDLGDRMDNLPSQLSGGQQQRVAIARAIAHNPKIIFADEPTANLDSETSDQVIKAFLDLNKEGQTIIMVTHEPEYAKMAHRTILLADGAIISDKMN